MRRNQKGFTLTELVVVIGILGLLASIAMPAYVGHTVKTRRATCMGELQGLAQQMERHFSSNSSYVSAIDGSAPAEPEIYPAQCPSDGSTPFYNLLVQEVDVTTYTLRADPISDTSQDADGYFELLSTGIKRWDRDNSGGIADPGEMCWSDDCE